MKKILPIIIVIIAIIGVGAGLVVGILAGKYAPTEELMDYAAQFELDDDEYTIALNAEILEERAVSADGRVYLGLSLVTEQINTRFYYDDRENVFIYTTPTQRMLITPDQQTYTVSAWEADSEADEGYVIVRTIDDQLYVAADYVTQYTQMDYAEYTDPNRIVIRTEWPAIRTVTVTKETALRYRGGVKAEVLATLEEGTALTVLDEYDDWTMVESPDGYIGWVNTEHISEAVDDQLTAPDFEEPVYTSIPRGHKIIMGWHQVMNTSANENISSVLDETSGINTISPTWFYFGDTEGNVTSIASADYVSTCHARGVEVWALFSNEFAVGGGERSFDTAMTSEVLSCTSKRQNAIRQVISYAVDNGIDGINIDFEAIDPEYADDYIEFIRELSIACRAKAIILSVDNYVPAYTSYYNRKEQGIVADYVVIMGYDEYTAGSDEPGPVASLDYVRQGIADTVAMVDPAKVINGMPFYSRVWSTDADGNVSSFACGMEEALGYLTAHGVTPEYLEDYGLNYGSYTSDVDGNFYEIWLQDADSIDRFMALAVEQDIAGVAAWKIGFESSSDIWQTISGYYH